jgi:glutaredoxin
MAGTNQANIGPFEAKVGACVSGRRVTVRDVVIYTREGCHLCKEAEEALVRHGLHPRLVDIDADSLLRERYNECVPVVEIDGRERFRGRVNEVLLRRLVRDEG